MRAQFYNIIGCVDSEKFICAFTKWMQKVVQGDVAGKTVAIDGKTICSTNKLSKLAMHCMCRENSQERYIVFAFGK